MRKLAKILLLISIFLLGGCVNQQKVKATEVSDYVNDTNDYSDIQSVIDDSMISDESFSFGEYVGELVASKDSFSLKNILGGLKDGIVGEIRGNMSTLTKMIAIAILAAIFTNFATVFLDNQVAETGFYITYILLFTIIISSFYQAVTLTTETVDHVLDFVKVLMPTYFMSVTIASGTTTSMMFYEFTLAAISLVNVVLIKIIIPAINIYLVILLADNLVKEDRLSKLADTLGTIIKWVLRSLIVLVIGFNAIQSLVAPVSDGLKRSIFVKMGGAIPGVGNLLSGVTETVMGASILLKNAIGVAGLVAIAVICAVPIIKLVVHYFIYRFCESIVQPISDKRILKCIGACSNAVSMLLQVVIVAAILFIISITIVTASTTLHT